ncbi:Gfo/Idh/MocA family protein [Cerasicoccus maritimus]|uniref:Gfo/Idh/MocA family protein n=1 Tax=Cerasicoccus maritimus TaxID=490089 RepID=UPI0028524AB6|nr:Gfo/Idh/MocA family oxidoreductase [Cerasicoccus maritimus]
MSKDGMNYAPTAAKPKPVVEKGEYVIAATHLDHGHIMGEVNGLTEAGAVLKYIYEPNPAVNQDKIDVFLKDHPEAKVVDSLDAILEDDSVHMVAAAAIPNLRGPLGCKVMEAGKDYLTDKCPFTTLEQLATAREVAARTGQKYMVYYSERVHVESAWYVDQLIQDGAIGDIVHMEIFGPHSLNKPSRPEWFFDKEQYGGILTDIASHQFDQFLHYTRQKSGEVVHARVDNLHNQDTPGLEDIGEAVLKLDNGVSCFSRVNWFSPKGARGWGDGRSFITGTKGTIEIRKYFDNGRSNEGNIIILCDQEGDQELRVTGEVGFPFFGQLILDSLNRTENAMTQEHAFLASELSMRAQKIAEANR